MNPRMIFYHIFGFGAPMVISCLCIYHLAFVESDALRQMMALILFTFTTMWMALSAAIDIRITNAVNSLMEQRES